MTATAVRATKMMAMKSNHIVDGHRVDSDGQKMNMVIIQSSSPSRKLFVAVIFVAVIVMVCGRCFSVAIFAVADIFCGRRCCGRHCL